MTDNELNELWKKYDKSHSRELRDTLICEYASLVKIVAGRLCMYLGNNVEFDELVSFGIFGLIDAIDKYRLDMSTKFETYASLRIRGEILDQLRKLDWIPRTVRTKQKEYNNVEQILTNRLHRRPTDQEMIEELGVSEDEYYLTQSKLLGTNIVYLDESVSETNDSGSSLKDSLKQHTFESPDDSVLKNELKEKLELALNKLTDKERLVIVMYYYEDLSLKEIAEVIEVSGSRVSQLHTKAIQKLKQYMGEYMEFFYKSV